ncbi:MAG: hypothetical protein N2506_04575, partial [Dehalococcoidales bacterium]|nr:hypothetical protein [Dehalococcoidales bacterium]
MPKADIVLKNARIITMEAGSPAADFVAIAGDRILCLGSRDELDGVCGAGTRVIDCGGKACL